MSQISMRYEWAEVTRTTSSARTAWASAQYGSRQCHSLAVHWLQVLQLLQSRTWSRRCHRLHQWWHPAKWSTPADSLPNPTGPSAGYPYVPAVVEATVDGVNSDVSSIAGRCTAPHSFRVHGRLWSTNIVGEPNENRVHAPTHLPPIECLHSRPTEAARLPSI